MNDNAKAKQLSRLWMADSLADEPPAKIAHLLRYWEHNVTV
jgi:hypothetical protein